MKPQTKRVLRRLQDAGPRGVHTNELRSDPEGWIADPPTRVSELKKLGYHITSSPERLHGKAVGRRYTLRSSPPSVCDEEARGSGQTAAVVMSAGGGLGRETVEVGGDSPAAPDPDGAPAPSEVPESHGTPPSEQAGAVEGDGSGELVLFPRERLPHDREVEAA